MPKDLRGNVRNCHCCTNDSFVILFGREFNDIPKTNKSIGCRCTVYYDIVQSGWIL